MCFVSCPLVVEVWFILSRSYLGLKMSTAGPGAGFLKGLVQLRSLLLLCYVISSYVVISNMEEHARPILVRLVIHSIH